MNCGSCRVTCESDDAAERDCHGGACRETCRPGLTSCSVASVCRIELAFDDDHCGACGVACGAAGRCVAGRCASVDARPIAPLSTARLGGQRPRFRWQRAAGVDGVRLQVCADRGCGRVERVEDIVGDVFRLPVALSPGPHFWRLFARRGTALSTVSSPVWEFIVPNEDGTRDVIGYTLDLDGDGLPDSVTRSTEPSDWSTRTVITVRLSTQSSEVTRHGPAASTSNEQDPVFGGPVSRQATRMDHSYAADVDGDGFGDLIGWRLTTVVLRGSYDHSENALDLLRGGDRQIATFFTVVESASAIPRWTSMGVTPVGDIDGDGYADLLYSGSYDSSVMVGSSPRVRFGGPSTLSAPSPEARLGDGGHGNAFLPGDFNGDGIVDLAAQSLALSSTEPMPVRTYSFIGVDRSNPIVRVLNRCPAAEAVAEAAGLYLPQLATIREVTDVNGDGFDDLRATPYWLNAVHAEVTWFGGPDGLSSDRCAIAFGVR